MKKPKMLSKLEEKFAIIIRTQPLPKPVREYRFCKNRKWRFDFAWPEQRVAVELEGGIRDVKLKDGRKVKGRHTHPTGFLEDCEKYNTAALLGWKLFRFSSPHLKNLSCLPYLEKALTPKISSVPPAGRCSQQI